MGSRGRRPSLARNDDFGRRYYTWGNETFWSVTTIISGGVPKYLHAHYAKLAAELALEAIEERGPYSRSRAIVRRLTRLGRQNIVERQAAGELTSIKLDKLTERDLALRWIKGAAERHRLAAADRGSAVHAEAEALVLQHAREATLLYLAHEALTPWPEDIAGYQQGFLQFLDDWHPEFLATEFTIFNRTEACAGTGDAIMRIRLADGRTLLVLVDYKAGREIYAEVGLQLAAYSRGEFIGSPDGITEIPMIPVEAGAVLHLKANGTYRFALVRIDEPLWDAFRYAREVFRFALELAPTVFIEDLTPLQVAA